MQMIIDILVPGPSDINTSHQRQLLNHGRKLARIHHVVGKFTKCSGCLPFMLIVDNSINFTFCRPVWLCGSPFRPASISIFIPEADTGVMRINNYCPEMDY